MPNVFDGFFATVGTAVCLEGTATLAGEIDMWFELASGTNVCMRSAALDPTFPAQGSARLGVVYGWGTEYTGNEVMPAGTDVRNGSTFGAGGTEFTGSLVATSGSTVPPTPGTFTIANGGNGTATVVIAAAAGTATTEVYTFRYGDTAWDQAGTRTGNGSVLVPLAAGGYWFRLDCCESGGTLSSDIDFATISTGTSNSMHYQICQVVADGIAAAGLLDDGGSALCATLSWPPDWDRWTSGTAFVLPDSDEAQPNMTGVNQVEYGVIIVIAEQPSKTKTSLDASLLLRRKIRDLFVGKHLSGLADVWCSGETTSQVWDQQYMQAYQFISPLSLKFSIREARS